VEPCQELLPKQEVTQSSVALLLYHALTKQQLIIVLIRKLLGLILQQSAEEGHKALVLQTENFPWYLAAVQEDLHVLVQLDAASLL